ncbi:MAG: benzoyl-CoA 2,3-epoxidase subunit BoxB [Woeseiaceae bacterium]|nr:benzoyl-CoA 2,3-epoxidase subunit BoxB [Woeseiaceae bacterium]
MSDVDYTTLIPNNVDLASDERLKRALEAWYPKYLDWWNSTGPVDSADYQVYLRTAVGVDSEGWAKFGYVRMPEYRWGILLAPQEKDRKIAFGQHKGEPVWQDLPGEYRAMLRRLVVIQGDTEPASVEQQRFLGKTAPSLYDMRNLFQVNVEEGRHLWAMVYLLQKYFGRDGREEAEDLLMRRSGDADKPRILGAFNEKTPDWLSFFMFTTFTDRDGKMQLESLANSGWDPLARTTRFMLTEEGHHMFVGRTGVERVIQRSCEIMKENGITDPADKEAVRRHGGIDLVTIQKKINFHYSVTLDLFGAEISTNAANSFNASLKGRFREPMIDDDHQLENDTYPVAQVVDGKVRIVDAPALSSINARLCDDFIDDCEKVMLRWNRVFKALGIDYQLKLPHRAFHRAVGEFAGVHATTAGDLISESEWQARKHEWLASEQDLEYILSLMEFEQTPGKFANWIAAPRAGINGQPGDFEYVKLAA